MTQIRIRPIDDTPGTHVLIIAVGYYRHLLGGPEERSKVHLGLSVLNSPPISGVRLARWMIGGNGAGAGLYNPKAPLTTMEVLISSENDETLTVAGCLHNIEPASLPLVQAGFDRWIKEVQSNPNNVGVFYFCGHGLMGNGAEHILLLDDHGAYANRPFQTGSFDIANTVRALWRQVPAQLYIFIDACRTYNRNVGDALGSRSDSLLEDGASSENINSGTTWIDSTSDGEPAYGDSKGVSRFTEALMQALDGYCGIPQPGTPNWLVNGSALSAAMPKLLSMVNKQRGGDSQFCAPRPTGGRDAPLHITTQVPKVKVEIALSPEVFRLRSSYAIHNLADGTMMPITGGRAEGVWCTVANRGVYEVRIASAMHQPYLSGAQFFDPPYYHLPVEVEA